MILLTLKNKSFNIIGVKHNLLELSSQFNI